MVKFQSLDLLIRFGKEFSHRQIRSSGFNDTEFLICSFVLKNPLCSQLDVVKAMKLDKTTLAKSLTVLESKGYIRRMQDTHDRRKNRLQVTEEGERRLTDLLGLHDQWMQSVVSVLTSDEQKQLDSFIHRLLEEAEKQKKTD